MSKTKIKILMSMVVCLASMVAFPAKASAIGLLTNPKDLITNDSLNGFSRHTTRFGIPFDAAALGTSDYIIIDMPYFSNVTEPVSISGTYTGSANVSVLGTRIRITGIAAAPGTMFNIGGHTAYNPGNYDEFDVYIRICDDADGISVRNEAHIISSLTDGSITVSAAIEAKVGTLKVSGVASPNAFITFSEGGTVIGTTLASNNGNFSEIFPGINPVLHTIVIYGTDALNRSTPATTVEVFTRMYETTTVSGIILPPTFSLDKEQINRGETVNVSGMSVPGYLVKLFTEPPVQSFQVDVNADGNWSYAITDTAGMELGDHKVYALVQDSFGSQSLMSITLFFKVVESTTPTPGPTCDISRGDLNCDEHVDIIDFSVLLYYWGTSEEIADVNKDNGVNIIDFSVMMFYWNG